MLSVRLKGFAACVGDSYEAGTRSNVICKLRDTPIPISIEILKPAGTNTQEEPHERASHVYRSYRGSRSTQFTMSPR